MSEMYFADVNGRVTNQRELQKAAVGYIAVQPVLANVRKHYLHGDISYDVAKRMRDRTLAGEADTVAMELYRMTGGIAK